MFVSEKEEISKFISEETKNRRNRKFMLIIICLLAIIYSYPVLNFINNPTIDITSISIKIPLKDVITIFPTIIASVYLVFLSSAIKQTVLLLRMHYYNFAYMEF